ncbi:MAG: cold-shock protein [Caulobacter vibrioides]|uniref:Cold-shock protein n=1 Tax=Caulobacter vibrioides TaxID=155892 RepID=A0A258D9E3_CAUVI|nr:MAG: cold-shock protein [Caulobacter vibrioides]
MARDPGLEEMLWEDLDGQPGLATKAMFGGLAWLLDGNLLCAASQKGMLVRLGKGQDGWALQRGGVEPLRMTDRAMPGWLRAGPDAYGDDALRRELIAAALAFVRTLPPK